ncbi:hypothetical protein ACFL2Z_00835 [Candidatus Eisenbacteria bacterium]|uniref:Uncharacterized protein n=1 Tax=Eiseniibacteriota bacterium TaxID=2212470 RepID=A0ABV6YN28_UNCEI
MNIKDWARGVSEAYVSLGKVFPKGMEKFLLSKAPREPTAGQQQDLINASEVLLRRFFVKASRGEMFGSVGRIEKRLGRSILEYYGIQEGVFAAAARTYWTFEAEAEDAATRDGDRVIVMALFQVKMAVSWLFVPTPPFMGMPVGRRIEEQRRYLSEYGPDIDIDAFVHENPLLEPEPGP